jgi:hypothetical protein
MLSLLFLLNLCLDMQVRNYVFGNIFDVRKLGFFLLKFMRKFPMKLKYNHIIVLLEFVIR